MSQDRRTVLKGFGAVGVGLALAGCSSGDAEETTDESTDDAPPETTEGTDEDASGDGDGGESSASAAVATELDVYRSQLYDTVALARAGEYDRAAAVTESVFGRFEGANGEYGAHEVLEATSEDAYEGFEGALENLQGALDEGDTEGAAAAATAGADHLRSAQRSLAGDDGTHALDLLTFGSRALNAGILANVGAVEAAGSVAQAALADFESASVHDAIESADGEAYEGFEGPLEEIVSVAEDGDARGIVDRARESAEAATDGAYALTSEAMAGAGHLAALQARGWDADAVAPLGGPGTTFAHAAALNVYRARAFDAGWLARHGAADTAATMAGDVFAHFEGARAHEGLEEADGEAYEGFEGALESLRTAIEDGDSDGIESAVASVDEHLRTGIEALAGEYAPVIQSGFFRARLADARELYRRDETEQAAAVVSELFASFEADELGFHESVEGTDEALYERFEEEHLTGLQSAYENDDQSAVATHFSGVLDALAEYEASFVPAAASGAGATYTAALAFDAAALDALGDPERAATLGQSALSYFEGGATGYHEALEEADEALYGRFEDEGLAAVVSAAENGGDVYAATKSFNDAAVDSVYAIADSAGGGSASGDVLSDLFGTFEGARAHELLEEADADAYETFEAELSAYIDGEADAAAFADAARTAQFAVLSAGDAAPGGSDGESDGSEDTDDARSDLSGGPNVVEGVPDDADHVVDMTAVAFEPAELTVAVGDTVAWTHAGGEPHNVVAYEEEIPEDADYWATGGFDGESAAREGWENGQGAVQSGQSYVHTFETAGEHDYFCVPHEIAGMQGTIVVEE